MNDNFYIVVFLLLAFLTCGLTSSISCFDKGILLALGTIGGGGAGGNGGGGAGGLGRLKGFPHIVFFSN